MLFLQKTDVQESCSSKRYRTSKAALSAGLHKMFLDFLYPVHTLALIRRLEQSTNAQNHAAQNIKHCSRTYTSVAKDFLNGAKVGGTATGAQVTDTSDQPQSGDAIRQGINEMLGWEDHAWVRDELWQSYQTLLEMSQSLSPQELIKMLRCLGTSQRTIDAERAVALFESIPLHQRRAIHYSYAVPAALSLEDLDTAVDIHREALARINGSIGTAAVLRYAVQHEKWQLAIDTWHAFWVDRLRYYTMPDIWTGVSTLPLADLMEKAILAVDFANLTAESSHDESAVAARDFALEVTRQAFCVQNTTFDFRKHWRLIGKARHLDPSDMTTPTMALKQLLSASSREHGHRALYLYRRLRKEPTFLPSRDIVSTVMDRLMAEKSTFGMLMMLQDWGTYHQKVPAGIAIKVAAVFASIGQLEHLLNLFDYFLSTYGRPNNGWYLMLLFVYNRRADTQGVVRAFDELPKKHFRFKRNLQAWNYVIGTFCRIGDVDGALGWLNKLLESELRPDSRTYFLLMSMYAKRGDREAVSDFYEQSKLDGVRTSTLMINTLVLANINDERLAEAEQLVKESLHVDLEGSRTFMWTILLNAYALRKNIEKVSELHKQMRDSGIVSDGMTYAALMTSLTMVKMPDSAYKLLSTVLPRANLRRTALHYTIVMGGFLANRQYGKVFEVYRSMLNRALHPTISTQNHLLRAAASLDKADQNSDLEFTGQTELVRAQQAFEQTISSLDLMELAASEPRKFVGPDPLDEAFSSTYFDYMILLNSDDTAFANVTELYERYISTSARFSDRDVEASPPIRLLRALMVAHLRAGNHEEVERCWNLALDKSKKLACRAKAVTSEPGWVLHSRRFIMNLPLRQYITSLSEQGRFDDLRSTIDKLNTSGFALNSPVLNHYIQRLVQSPEPKDQLLAFQLCESELIHNWPGWDVLGNPGFVRGKLNKLTRNLAHSWSQRMPEYRTLVRLASVYLQAKLGTLSIQPRRLVDAAPRTVDAVINMPRVADEDQITLLRGG